MANVQYPGTLKHFEHALIDTAPGASGFWCQSVSMSRANASRLICSRRGGGAGTVSIQYQTAETGATWQDYVGDLEVVDGNRLLIEDHAAGVKWRIGVKQGDYISGDIRVGIDW